MITNGLDIVGYDFVKFHRSTEIKHVVDGKDIHLYGSNSKDFSSLFSLYKESEISDSKYIDLRPGGVSKFGSLAVQSNSVDDVILNVAIVADSETRSIVIGNSIIILVNEKDVTNIDLASMSSAIKLLQLAKPRGEKINNVANAVIKKNQSIITQADESDRDYTVRSVRNPNLTNINFPRYLNKLNSEIMKLLPDFDLFINRKDFDKKRPNTVLCDYDTIDIYHKKFFGQIRRNMFHDLRVMYEFRVSSDDIQYLKLLYEMTNYDFITNICELKVKDDSGNDWTFAIHWEIENPSIDLSNVQGGNENTLKVIRATARINFITSLDFYWKGIIKTINRYRNDKLVNTIE